MTILPTSRAIRSRLLKEQEQDGFLPSYITMSEFLQRALVVEGYVRVDEDTRTLLLLEASDFKQFSALQIERNFFTFTQNSSYIFRFFEELSGELLEINALDMADTYGDYEEHIEILKELYARYEKLCEEKKILDPIFLSKKYRLNEAYVRSAQEIELYVEGYLTNFELKILTECAQIVPLRLHFYANRFNTKMQEKLKALSVAVVSDKNQTINLSRLTIETVSALKKEYEISCESFSQRVLQVAFIKQKVYEFTQKGIKAENIAVILPDESFAQHLRRFDTKCNFNFAMGESLVSSTFVHALNAVTEYLDTPSVQNRSRINRIGAELVEAFAGVYKADVDGLDFRSLLQPFMEKEKNKAVLKIIDEELFYFDKLLGILQGSSFKSALHLFINRLKNRSTDDVRGGKVTVMGVLETRMVAFEGVIVVDFNEGTVPRKSEKDLFLNSSTRIAAGLPGAQEREALQKLYYSSLFMRARHVAISYVDSAESLPSRFLTQLGIATTSVYEEEQWAGILFEQTAREKLHEQKIECAYDFTEHALSATGLKSFLTCKRRFYHRYIDGLQEHQIEKDLPQEHEIGTALHEALKKVYEEKSRYSNAQELTKAISAALKESAADTVLDRYLQKIWIQRLEPFVASEIERFKEAEVLSCEKRLSAEVCGIRLSGQIDRIDRTLEGLEVLDYKSGNYPIYTARTVDKATDFQLEFYYLLAKNEGEVKACGYYDLKNGKIIPEELLEKKLELLYEHLHGLRETKFFDFEKTDEIKECRFCPYTHLCGREL
ncbi:MAG: PD-(D/E)XK nuclease family protein [Campylobacterales bacterium]|nr:PD-(D/E)XK nuclease family protein [Campylobacterales bacterium]